MTMPLKNLIFVLVVLGGHPYPLHETTFDVGVVGNVHVVDVLSDFVAFVAGDVVVDDGSSENVVVVVACVVVHALVVAHIVHDVINTTKCILRGDIIVIIIIPVIALRTIFSAQLHPNGVQGLDSLRIHLGFRDKAKECCPYLLG